MIKNWGAIDIETLHEGTKLTPYCISLIWGREEIVFYGKDANKQFLNKLFDLAEINKINRKKKIKLFSHNLTFDGSILIQNLPNGIQFDGLFYKGSIYSLELIKGNLSVKIMCSYRFFPAKLESGYKLLNIKKKGIISFNEINWGNIYEKKEEIEKYCKNDAILAKDIIKKFDEIMIDLNFKWDDKCYSIPSAAFKIFKEKFNTKEVSLSLEKKDDALFRTGYYGGRCEVFGNPSQPDELLYHFDFKGMYSQCMLEEMNYGNFTLIKEVEELTNNGFFSVDFESDIEIPVLPQHISENNKLMFINGDGSGLYWHEEISLFRAMGGKIKKINYQIRFEKEGVIFEDFIAFFKKKREESIAGNFFGKLLINSIYGRFGMGPKEDTTKIIKKERIEEFREKNEKNIIEEIEVGEMLIVKIKTNKQEESNSNVYIAAIITSKARIKLYNGFMDTIKNGGRLLYCDTDSIFAAFKKNVDNQKMGEIFWDTTKQETKLNKLCCAMPKAYSYIQKNGNEITKLKGISEKISFDTFQELFKSGKNMESEVESLKKRKYIINIENVKKVINLRKYDKRVFDEKLEFTQPLYKYKNKIELKKLNKEEEELKNYATEKNINSIWNTEGQRFFWVTSAWEERTMFLKTLIDVSNEEVKIVFIEQNIDECCEIIKKLLELGIFSKEFGEKETLTDIFKKLKKKEKQIIFMKYNQESAKAIQKLQLKRICKGAASHRYS